MSCKPAKRSPRVAKEPCGSRWQIFLRSKFRSLIFCLLLPLPQTLSPLLCLVLMAEPCGNTAAVPGLCRHWPIYSGALFSLEPPFNRLWGPPAGSPTACCLDAGLARLNGSTGSLPGVRRLGPWVHHATGWHDCACVSFLPWDKRVGGCFERQGRPQGHVANTTFYAKKLYM